MSWSVTDQSSRRRSTNNLPLDDVADLVQQFLGHRDISVDVNGGTGVACARLVARSERRGVCLRWSAAPTWLLESIDLTPGTYRRTNGLACGVDLTNRRRVT